MPDTAIPGLSVPTTTPAVPPGLINAAPGSTTQTPGQTPPGGTVGAPVTSYTPAQATAAPATPAPFTVTPEQTVSGQIKKIIASGSPLMQQAETNAKNLMNQRGLINSSQAITAGQSAVIGAAAPIAAADASTYAKAATDTTAALNAASTTNAQLGTATSQFNAGAQNTSLGAAATASNSIAQTAQQITGSKDVAAIQGQISTAIATLQANTSMSNQDKQDATSQIIAGIQANTSLSLQDKQSLTSLAIQQSQSDLQTYLGRLSSSTTLSAQQMATQSSQLIAQLQASTSLSIQDKQGAVSTFVANLQANTSLSNQDKQDLTQTAIAGAQTMTQRYLGDLSANTQLTVQDKAAAAQAALAAVNNVSAQAIAGIQANTALSVEQQQTQSAQIVAGLNNTNAQTVQRLVNAGNLATIQANGTINEQITQMTNDNRLLLQTSSAATSVYGQTLANMAAILNNKDLSNEQKTAALNDGVAGLNDALVTIGHIANNQAIGSTLTFNTPPGTGTTTPITLPGGGSVVIPGGATTGGQQAPAGWNEQQYLANNPDVANALATDPYWHGKTALDHYLQFGQAQNRSFTAPATGGAISPPPPPPPPLVAPSLNQWTPNAALDNGTIDPYQGLTQADYDSVRREAGFPANQAFGGGAFETWLNSQSRAVQIGYINKLEARNADPDYIRQKIAALPAA